jgi:hypothetical protein
MPSSHEQDNSALVGVWRLLKYETEFKDGSPPAKLFGDSPRGRLIFTAKGHMAAVLEASNRIWGTTDAERAALYLSTVAYTGTYRIEGDRWITKVDASSSPFLSKAEQVRFYEIENDQLLVTSPWGPDPRMPEKSDSRGVLLWQKVE